MTYISSTATLAVDALGLQGRGLCVVHGSVESVDWDLVSLKTRSTSLAFRLVNFLNCICGLAGHIVLPSRGTPLGVMWPQKGGGIKQ